MIGDLDDQVSFLRQVRRIHLLQVSQSQQLLLRGYLPLANTTHSKRLIFYVR